MRNRRVVGGVAALVFAVVGTIALVAYVGSAEDRALAGEEVVEVLVVDDPIGAGAYADDIGGKVRVEKVPAKVRATDALENLDTVRGMVASVDLKPGEQLILSRFISREAFRPARLDVPDGLLEVTLSLDPERAIGGSLVPGDTVAVVASFEGEGAGQNSSGLILHKVLVTQVQIDRRSGFGSDDEKDEKDTTLGQTEAPDGKLLITLAIDAASVERVVYAAEHGSVWLASEPPEAPVGGTGIQTRATVFGR